MTLAESNSARREMSKFMVQVYHSAILDDIQIYGDYAQEYNNLFSRPKDPIRPI
jgi:hypothetical protein